MTTAPRLFIYLIIFGLGSFILALHSGSLKLHYSDILLALSGKGPTLDQQVILSLRLPLIFVAFITGGLLSLAGALLQVLLRNPLADPYVLGISGGSAVASLVAILLGLPFYAQSLSGFIGAILAIGLLFIVASKQRQFSSERLLLCGIIMAAGWGAVISFILILSPNEQLHNLLYWLMGDIEPQPWAWLGAIVLVLGLIYAYCLAQPMNLLIRGELQAKSLGVNCKALRIQLYFLSGILTATAVSMAGCIGFVGLVVPHIIRLLVGSNHRYLLPASVLLGGSLLMLAASLARSLLAPMQLPVGIITALIGIPIFLVLLLKSS